MSSEVKIPLQFDHLSIIADGDWLGRCGFVVTRTVGAERQHGRIFLDGCYLETRFATHEGLVHYTGWFARAPNLTEFLAHARELNIETIGPTTYHGFDGSWSDVEILGEAQSAALPTVTRRETPHETATHWPPQPGDIHPNASTQIARLGLTVPDPARDAALLAALAGVAPPGECDRPEVALPAGTTIDFALAAGPEDCGITEIVIATRSLQVTREVLVARDIPVTTADDRLWLQTKAGARFGFVEHTAGSPAAGSPLPIP